ncbi:HEAT repeat domain-containing protein [Bremerella sp. T1]|uniref:HEAT repeat domain-containing protein n=1 Tax=Bremerella sp. TYQ1 TaxID=3119568 RepID=UPI001CCB8605|nr:HEAT repeat domain-containing protein [Bremerella volcania]UBM35733.1 HEAT repeat domain-containing protein [Bremerella volcania]
MVNLYAWINSTSAVMLAATVVAFLFGTAGCRSVVETKHDLTTLTASSAPAEESDAVQAAEVSDTPEPPPAVTAAETILAASVVQTSETSLRPKKIESRGWYLDQSMPLYEAFPARQSRWKHHALEGLLDQTESSVETLRNGAKSAKIEVAATASIGLVRLGHPPKPSRLAELFHHPDIAPTTQAALLEAMSLMTGDNTKSVVEGLFSNRSQFLDHVRRTDEDAASMLETQYWATLAAVSEDISEDPRFVANFDQHNPSVQATILDLLLSARHASAQTSIDDYFQSLSPEAIRRLGLWEPYLRSVAPLEELISQTRSPEFPSRQSATIGLGREGSAAAQAMLERVTENDPTLVQVASVFAWSLVQQHEAWERLAEASSWRVRKAVAQWIPLEPRNQAIIAKLKDDNSHQVRATIEKRSPELVGSVATEEAKKSTVKQSEVVELDADQVVEILDWIEQAQFGEKESVRSEARRQLLLQPNKVLAAVEKTAKPLSKYDNTYLFDVLLPQCDPVYQHVQEAISGNPRLSLSALRSLEQHARSTQLPELVVWRLSYHVESFTAMTWPAVMSVIQDDGREPAQNITRRALAHDNPAVRMEAYQHVSDFPMADVVSPIADGLQHEVPGVRIAAINALSRLDAELDPNLFVACLTDRDVDVQLAACESLELIGDERGINHLYRMTYSSSKTVRLKAVQAISLRKKSSDVPVLIRLLDDDTSIRSTALDGLSSIVPLEEHPKGISRTTPLEAKCAAWKKWFDRQDTLSTGNF